MATARVPVFVLGSGARGLIIMASHVPCRVWMNHVVAGELVPQWHDSCG
jgi:hypothetical protein